MDSIGMLEQERSLITNLVKNTSADDLLVIPNGFSNNILWNLGHVVVTQQLLHYALASLPLHVSDELVSQCRRGTSPKDWASAPDSVPDVEMLLEQLVSLPETLREDYQAGRFNTFKPYTTSTGIRFETIDDALTFNHFHEGLHAGAMRALKKAIAAT
ncbi:MAG: DinB family protein [Deinococcota bacterium]